MIAFLRGELAHVGQDAVIVDVNGVGYQVFLSQRHLGELGAIGQSVRIHTHLVHREDAMLLYGFPAHEEREMFLMLVSVSGIGAKTAMGVLSSLSVSEIVTSVVGNHPKRLAQAPGIGKKTAERIVLELREKLGAWKPSGNGDERPAFYGEAEGASPEIEAALSALGYSDDEIALALARIEPAAEVEETLRRALAYLATLG